MRGFLPARFVATALQAGSHCALPCFTTRALTSSAAGPVGPSDSSGDSRAPASGSRRRRHKGRRIRTRSSGRTDEAAPGPTASKRSSAYATAHTGFFDTTAVPRSLDVGAQEALVDVERFFPAAMAHLKAPPSTPAVAAAREARRWHEETHTVNVDGYRPVDRPSEEDAEAMKHTRSFFDQGSLDIRGGLADVARASSRNLGREGATAAGRDLLHRQPLQSRQERLSPDILQLTGGKPRLHGTALAEKSNAAPADLTLEPEEGNYMGKNGDQGSEFGDTPPQLTDMLRERLMELKGLKLREERNDTFMPKRLALKSDAEVARERRSSAERERRGRDEGGQQLLLQLATKAAAPAAKSRTLADVLGDDDEDATDASPRNGQENFNSAPVPAIRRDGVSSEQQRLAAAALRRAHGDPSSGSSSELDKLLDLDQPFGGSGRSQEGDGGTADSVYLLRVLPRASFCSRREAAAIIASGQVRVNNVVERNPFKLVRAEDDVHVAGHQSRLRFAPPRLWVYHKPANVIVSRNDVAGRTLIGKHARILGMDHLIPVGSLPMRAHGILLLTNDGELSRFLENPRANLQQTYLLRVRPAIDAVLAHKLNTEGININGRQYRGTMEFMVNPAAKSRYSVKVKVRGESLPISHVMQHLGRKIERGGRVSFGPFSLSTLPVGSLREVTVPPFYADRLGAVWKPFVERDWPYFRRQRVSRLRRLCRYRELTPRELEELDNYTYEEMQDALRFDEQELDSAASARGEDVWRAQDQRPSFFSGKAIPHDFPASPSAGAYADGNGSVVDTLKGTEWAERAVPEEDDFIVEDITSVV